MPLTAHAPNLWTLTQPLRFLGLDIGTRMTVVRLPSGALVLISPIKLSDALCQELDQLGPVHHIIAPNRFHHLFVGPAHAHYPNAKVWGAAGLAEKRPDLQLDAILDQPGSFENVLDYLQLEGFASILPSGIELAQETVFYHRPSRTLILTDTAFNFDETNAPIVRFGAQLLGAYKGLSPSRLEKWGSRNKAPIEASVRKVLAWDFDRVILAHGAIVETDGKEQFQTGYEWFLDKPL
jgi:hypothetical protein